MILLVDERLPWPNEAWSLSRQARVDLINAKCYFVGFDDDGNCTFNDQLAINLGQSSEPLVQYLRRHRQQVEPLDIAVFFYTDGTDFFQVARTLWGLTSDTLSIRLTGFILSKNIAPESEEDFLLGAQEMIQNPYGGEYRRIFDSIFFPTPLSELGDPVSTEEAINAGEHLFHAASVLGSDLFSSMGAFSAAPDEPFLIGYGLRSWSPTAAECLRVIKELLPLLISKVLDPNPINPKQSVVIKDFIESHLHLFSYDASGGTWEASLLDLKSRFQLAEILKLFDLPEDFENLPLWEKIKACDSCLLYEPTSFKSKAENISAKVAHQIEGAVRTHREEFKNLTGKIRIQTLQRLNDIEREFAKILTFSNSPSGILRLTEKVDFQLPQLKIGPCPQLHDPSPTTIRAECLSVLKDFCHSIPNRESAKKEGILGALFQRFSKSIYLRLATVYPIAIAIFATASVAGTFSILNLLFSLFAIPSDFPSLNVGLALLFAGAFLMITTINGKRICVSQINSFREMFDSFQKSIRERVHLAQQQLDNPVQRLAQHERILFTRLFSNSAAPTISTLRRIMQVFVSQGEHSLEASRILNQLDLGTQQRLTREVKELLEQLLADFREGKTVEETEAHLNTVLLRLGSQILNLEAETHKDANMQAVKDEINKNGPALWAPFDHGELNVGVSRIAVAGSNLKVPDFFPPHVPDSRFEQQITFEISPDACIPAILIKSKRLVTCDQFRQLSHMASQPL